MLPQSRLWWGTALGCALCLALAGAAPAQIYWANSGGTSIGRANNDGSGPDQNFVTGAGAPTGVAIDGTFLYWAHTTAGLGKLGRSGLDGTGPDQSFITVGDPPLGIALDGSRIYWTHTSAGAGKVGRTNIDGSGPLTQQFVPTGASPCGVAVEPDHTYWANTGAPGAIGRSHGSTVGPNFVTATSNPCGVAYAAGWLYWANRDDNTIGRVRLEGTELDPDFVSTGSGAANSPCGVAVDGTHVYWTAAGGTIGRVGLDGTEFNASLVSGATSPCGMAVSATASITPTAYAFSQTATGAESDIQTLFLANTSSSALQVGTASITGPDAGAFQVTGDGCSSRRIAPGNGCVINLRFTPGGVGAMSGTLSISSSAAGPPKNVQLTGQGVAPPLPAAAPPQGDLTTPPAAPNPGPDPGGGSVRPASPAAGLTQCASRIKVSASGIAKLCKASNPPIAEAVQTLTAAGGVVGRGRTTVPPGKTESVVARLSGRARKALRRGGVLRVRSEIVVRAPGGGSSTVKRRLTLRTPPQ